MVKILALLCVAMLMGVGAVVAYQESFPVTGMVVKDSTPWWLRERVNAGGVTPIMRNGTNETNGTMRVPKMTAPAAAPRGIALGRDAFNVTCVQDAIDNRDTELINAYDTYHSAISDALNTRKDALKAAWALEGTARKDAIKAAWDVYKVAQRDAGKALKDSRSAAWTQFQMDLKPCNAPAAVDTTTASVDTPLAQ